jgi:uncharacterized protein (DUF302 family)
MKRFILMIAAAGLAACSAKTEQPAAQHGNGAMQEHHEPHIIQSESAADFAATLSQLQAAIGSRSFTIFTVIDHAAGAASAGQSLPPSTLFVFGNPQSGSAIMQAEQTMGLELPLKMLVSENAEGAVYLTWRDMGHTFHEYGIGDHPAAEKVSNALAAIAAEAGAQPPQ